MPQGRTTRECWSLEVDGDTGRFNGEKDVHTDTGHGVGNKKSPSENRGGSRMGSFRYSPPCGGPSAIPLKLKSKQQYIETRKECNTEFEHLYSFLEIFSRGQKAELGTLIDAHRH